MASPSMSIMRCLLMVVLLAVHGGIMTPVNSQPVAECGERCGGFVMRMCVEECHCVFYPGDWGLCLAHGMNESNLPPLTHL
ncbi:hypothetical protein MTO96_048309 [Rhipicephalus appendiculatus]